MSGSSCPVWTNTGWLFSGGLFSLHSRSSSHLAAQPSERAFGDVEKAMRELPVAETQVQPLPPRLKPTPTTPTTWMHLKLYYKHHLELLTPTHELLHRLVWDISHVSQILKRTLDRPPGSTVQFPNKFDDKSLFPRNPRWTSPRLICPGNKLPASKDQEDIIHVRAVLLKFNSSLLCPLCPRCSARVNQSNIRTNHLTSVRMRCRARSEQTAPLSVVRRFVITR
uniref:Uncharacterized protein n=1 Tax=Timema cristinae TaxID=61476 RepID=A0A7R9D4N1_TIMCR|nr:unnamed protein product [Timema cristinae]